MGWDDAPPKKEELATSSWDSEPPKKEELRPTSQPQPQQKTSWLDTQLPFGTSPRGLIQGGLNLAPMVGTGVGGLVGGGVGGPLGALGGAGIGAAGGAAVKNLGEGLLGQPKTRNQIYGDPVRAVPEGMMAEASGQILGKVAEAATNSKPAQWVGEKVGRGMTKLGHALSGIPEEEIKTYAQNAPDIRRMKSMSDGDMAEAADQMRQKFTDAVDLTRRTLNEKLSGALKDSSNVIDGKQVLEALNEAKSAIDPDLYPEQHQQIYDLTEKIMKKMGDNWQMSVQDAHSVKQFLQEKASSAYRSPGDIFFPGSGAAKAAKSGARTARGLVNDAEPVVQSANNTLASLHDVEDRINPNLITPKTPHSALLAAGSGGNPQNAKTLEELSALTGVDMLSDAKKLAALRTFGSPAIMPVDTTGKSVGRMMLGTALGAGAGGLEGGEHGAKVGAAVGGAMTSPMAIKVLIDSGLLGQKAVSGLLSDPVGRNLIGQAVTGGLLTKKKP